MNCPVCDSVRMREVERENVLIDICPNCKGVWLDRGELEKLLQVEASYEEPRRREYPQKEERIYPDYRESKDKHYKYKKKKSMFDILGDIFD